MKDYIQLVSTNYYSRKGLNRLEIIMAIISLNVQLAEADTQRSTQNMCSSQKPAEAFPAS